MKTLARLLIVLLAPLGPLQAAELQLTSPLDYQVVQRSSRESGSIPIAGAINVDTANDVVIQAKLISETGELPLQALPVTVIANHFETKIEVPAGGWYQVEVQVSSAGKQLARATVQHVGVGEVFVVAGQSNSANHGEVKQVTKSKRVAAFDGQRWQLADDPQPGASGQAGSFLPILGDEVVDRLQVPVGFVACGIGATSVREWLPKATMFPNPPTIESRVEKLNSGEWVSNGEAFSMFVARMRSLGPHGFRAVLWHQGESDANQSDATRTLAGNLYREYLAQIIRDSRAEIGWEAPWFVAQVSYHTPGDESSADIRAAQASLWKDGLAWQGPDSDALKGDLREQGGQGVHFSDKGLKVHGLKWAEQVCPWIDNILVSEQ